MGSATSKCRRVPSRVAGLKGPGPEVVGGRWVWVRSRSGEISGKAFPRWAGGDGDLEP
jgi:hypothetical protein